MSMSHEPSRRRDQQGITTVEYVIMLVLIAVGVLLAGPSLVSAIVGIFSKTSSLIGT